MLLDGRPGFGRGVARDTLPLRIEECEQRDRALPGREARPLPHLADDGLDRFLSGTDGANALAAEPLAAAMQREPVDPSGHFRVLDAAELREAPLGPAGLADLHGLIDHDVRLAAGDGTILIVSQDSGLQLDVARIDDGDATERFVGRSFGQDDDVVRLTTAQRELIHAVDE